MAKKNSTKTATKEAMQAAEPKIQALTSWTGIDISRAPLEWSPMETGDHDHNQSNLIDTYLMVQNNIDLQPDKTLETRPDIDHIVSSERLSLKAKFTGVSCMYEEWVIAAMDNGRLYAISVEDGRAFQITALLNDTRVYPEWTDVTVYESCVVALAKEGSEGGGRIFSGSFDEDGCTVQGIRTVADPTIAPKLEPMGSLIANADGYYMSDQDGDGTEEQTYLPTRVTVCYTYTTMYGQTLASPATEIWCDYDPVTWSYTRYMKVYGALPSNVSKFITGVDIYWSTQEYTEFALAGHIDISDEDRARGGFEWNWLGYTTDTSTWVSSPTGKPTENTTGGVDATHLDHHDGRYYFYGGTFKDRLWIGGNPQNELTVSRGCGGGYVDVEPGHGHIIHGVHKFKTYNGASIVTLMCGNRNTSNVKRFNLLETSLTLTNEVASKGYMIEEVANVVGCNSYHGSGVWADGLYAVSRYGLMVTTQAMESNNQLQAQECSFQIEPVFKDENATRIQNSYMTYIDGRIYIVLGDEDPEKEESYDNVIFVYDIQQKAWWTYTYGGGDEKDPDDDQVIKALLPIDYEGHIEGLGIITEDRICMIPTTGKNDPEPSKFYNLIETPEITMRAPVSSTTYLCQLEFRFDYIIGDLDIEVEGIDYYGRHFRVIKQVRVKDLWRKWQEWVRIDKLVETWRIRIKGKARFRMTHILVKTYNQSSKINLVYGFDDMISYRNRHGGQTFEHHYLDSYNNLREAIVT